MVGTELISELRAWVDRAPYKQELENSNSIFSDLEILYHDQKDLENHTREFLQILSGSKDDKAKFYAEFYQLRPTIQYEIKKFLDFFQDLTRYGFKEKKNSGVQNILKPVLKEAFEFIKALKKHFSRDLQDFILDFVVNFENLYSGEPENRKTFLKYLDQNSIDYEKLIDRE